MADAAASPERRPRRPVPIRRHSHRRGRELKQIETRGEQSRASAHHRRGTSSPHACPAPRAMPRATLFDVDTPPRSTAKAILIVNGNPARKRAGAVRHPPRAWKVARHRMT